MCERLGVTRQGFYAWRKRPPSRRRITDAAYTAVIKKIHADSRGNYGAPRICAELADDYNIRCGRKRVARLMRQAGIAGCHRRKRTWTTRRDDSQSPAPDRVNRQFAAAGPNELWVADITYVLAWAATGVTPAVCRGRDGSGVFEVECRRISRCRCRGPALTSLHSSPGQGCDPARRAPSCVQSSPPSAFACRWCTGGAFFAASEDGASCRSAGPVARFAACSCSATAGYSSARHGPAGELARRPNLQGVETPGRGETSDATPTPPLPGRTCHPEGNEAR